ncbi:MAG: hypothetical protein V4773_11445 [Verrucomicrobiota bacterium]
MKGRVAAEGLRLIGEGRAGDGERQRLKPDRCEPKRFEQEDREEWKDGLRGFPAFPICLFQGISYSGRRVPILLVRWPERSAEL